MMLQITVILLTDESHPRLTEQDAQNAEKQDRFPAPMVR